MPPAEPDSLRPALCSELSARHGLPLIGTAGFYDAVIAFELPSPWTPKLAGSRASDPELDAAIRAIGRDAKRVRLLAIESDETRHDEAVVLVYRREPGPFLRYARTQAVVARDSLAATLLRIAGGSDEQAGPAPTRRDVLVCTHGARDACCGKFGFPLYRRFVEAAAADPALRVWRTSHLGGHRFAPTLLDLPSGRLYGRVQHEDVGAILRGGADLLPRLPRLYRGRCALPEAAQIVERELWCREGEAIETAHLSFEVRAASEGFTVTLEAATASGRIGAQAEVERSAVQAVETPASCGRDPEAEAPWRIRRLRCGEGGELDSGRGFS